MHQHHAIQLTISFNEPFEIISPIQGSKNSRFAIVPESIPHKLNSKSDEYIVCIYIDPFNKLAHLLKNKFGLNTQIIFDDNLLEQIPPVEKFFGAKNNDLNQLIVSLIECITDCTLTLNKNDIRIKKSIDYLTTNLDNTLKLSDAASFSCLSESRYAHLFKIQTGISFRRYVLWLRIQKTLLSILNGNSFTNACYIGGFTDLLHFNRTCQEMFGNSPSAIFKG